MSASPAAGVIVRLRELSVVPSSTSMLELNEKARLAFSSSPTGITASLLSGEERVAESASADAAKVNFTSWLLAIASMFGTKRVRVRVGSSPLPAAKVSVPVPVLPAVQPVPEKLGRGDAMAAPPAS